MAADNYRGAERVFGWSFYSQGTGERVTSADEFFQGGARVVRRADPRQGSPWERASVWREPDPGRSARCSCSMAWSRCRTRRASKVGKVKDPSARRAAVASWPKRQPGLCVDHHPRVEVEPSIADSPQTTAPRHRSRPAFDRGRHAPCWRRSASEAAEELTGAVDGASAATRSALNLLAQLRPRDILAAHARRVTRGRPDLDRPRTAIRGSQVIGGLCEWFAGLEAFASRFGEVLPCSCLVCLDSSTGPRLVIASTALRSPPVIAGLNDQLVQLSDA